MTELGITLDQNADRLPPAGLIDLVRQIERLGFESVWLLDAFGREPFVTATYILANTTRIKVGTGVANVYGRDPTSAAQIRKSLSEFFPGRFLMGLGASNAHVLAKRKAEWVAPLTKMTSYLHDMAEIEASLVSPPLQAPLYIAAHAPKLQSLANRLTNGIITWILPASLISRAHESLSPSKDITASIPCVLSADASFARTVGRQYLEFYISLDYYQKAWMQAGFEGSDFVDGGSDRLIDVIVAWGSASDIKARIQQFEEAGATRVNLNPIGMARANGKPTLRADWDALVPLASYFFGENSTRTGSVEA